jgi:hypothetical protein
VQRRDRMFTLVDAPAWQLEFRDRFGLMGRKDVVAPQENRVDAGATGVTLPGPHRFAVASDHQCPLGPDVALPI